MAESFLNQRTSLILSLILLGGAVRQGSLASPPSTAVTTFFSAENKKNIQNIKIEKNINII